MRERWIALVLAAGLSRRFGPENKLLADIAGKPMLQHVMEAALQAGLPEVLFVLGHEAERVVAGLAGAPVRSVINPDFASGLASSLRTGIAALPADVAGVVILLGDMPLVRPETIATLCRLAEAHPERLAIIPEEGGIWGNPVLIRAELFPALGTLEGDRGARAILQGRRDILVVSVADPGIHRDFDTPAALNTAPLS